MLEYEKKECHLVCHLTNQELESSNRSTGIQRITNSGRSVLLVKSKDYSFDVNIGEQWPIEAFFFFALIRVGIN